MRRLKFLTIASASLFLNINSGGAQTLPPDFVVENAASGATFVVPTAIAFTPDGRLLVAEKRGRVYVVENGVKLSTPFINLEDEILDQGDRGLLGLAVDPNFADNGYVYLLYGVDPNGDGNDEEQETFGRLTRYTASAADPNRADLSSRKVLIGETWGTGIPSCHTSHGPGTLRFGSDGTLLISAGDASPSSGKDKGGNHPNCFGPGKFSDDQDIGTFRAQYLGTLAGKILRVDPATGLGLPSNPYYTGNPSDPQSRIWAYGLRQPFRFAVRQNGSPDPTAGAPGSVYIGEVGWGQYEEINVVPAGGGLNFGWPCYEGPRVVNQYINLNPPRAGCDTIGSPENPADTTQGLIYWHQTDPTKSKPQGVLGASVTAGDFYTADRYPETYRGGFFFADFVGGWIRVLKVDDRDRFDALLDFATDAGGVVDLQAEPLSGDIHYVDIFTGQVLRIRYTGGTGNQNPVAVASAQPSSGAAPLTVQFTGSNSFDPDGDAITYFWDFGNGATSNAADPAHTYTNPGTFNATLTVRDPSGAEGTAAVSIVVGSAPPQATILSPENGSSIFATETVVLNGTATDPDEPTSNLSFQWNISLFHNQHAHPSTFIIDGPTGSFVPGAHGAPWDLLYLGIELRVTDSSGLSDTARAYVVLKVEGEQDITPLGTPIALVTNPSGSGNPDIEVIRDGAFPPVGSSDPLQQYDTSTGGGTRAQDWIGYEFGEVHRFSRVVFQEGIHFPNGGWFDDLTVEVRHDGQWHEVLFFNSVPPYPGNNGVNFETYALLFSPEVGDAIRVIGAPGGGDDFISVGELRVIETPTNIAVLSPNGGEIWQANSAQIITWSFIGPVERVDIAFSDDGGATWTPVASSVPNNGFYNWTVPNRVSNNCLIRISDANNPAIDDTSDAVFSIVEASTWGFALQFDGTNDYVQVADDAALRGGPGKSLTAEAWVNPSTASAQLPIVQKWQNSKWKEWGMQIDNGLLSVAIEKSGDNWEYKAGQVPAGVWTHVAFTYDATSEMVRIFLNGVEVGPGKMRPGGMPESNAPVYIGRHGYKERYFSGVIDEVRVWNHARSAGLLQASMNAPLTGNEPGLLAYWNFDEGQGQTANDRTGNGHDGQLNGPTWRERTDSAPPPQSITLLQPNGGETLEAGGTFEIRWNASASISNVKLELTTDNGASFTTIVSSTTNDGSYTWSVPDVSSTQARMRISDAADGQPVDLSDAVFEIVAPPSDFHAPVIFSITPTRGPVGTEVTVDGHDFVQVSQVAFGGAPATEVTVVTDSRLRARVPAGAVTGKVTVTNPKGTATSAQDYEVTPPVGATSFAPIHDAFVRSNRPTRNYGASPELRVRRTASAEMYTFLKFQVSGIGGPPARALLRLYVLDASDEGGAVYPVSNDFSDSGLPWTEDALLWDNAPALGGNPLGQLGAVSVGEIVELDVTATITGDGVYSFGLKTGSSDVARYSTKEGAVAPELFLELDGGGPPPGPGQPTITSFQPTEGVAGDEVTILGVNLSGATAVTFNTLPAAAFAVISDGEIRATVPAGDVTGPIAVTTPGGTATSAQDFVEIKAPQVTSFSPGSGPVGTEVTINGQDFIAVSEVTFNGVPTGTFAVDSFQQIRAVVPNGAGTGRVSVRNQAGEAVSSEDFVVTPPPSTVSFTPIDDAFLRSSRPRNNYGSSPELRARQTASADMLSFLKFSVTGIGGAPIRAVLRLYVLEGSVTGGAVHSAENNWEEENLLWDNRPALTTGPWSTLGEVVAGTTAEFDVTAAITGDGVYTFAIQSGSSDVVRYSSKEGQVAPQLVVEPGGGGPTPNPPVVSSFQPGSGPTGTVVTIWGSGFAGASQVTFNGVAAAGFTVRSDSELQATVPAGATTGLIRVTNADGTGVSADPFTVTAPPPVTTFLPTDDVFTRSNRPNKNYGLSAELRVRKTSSAEIVSYLKFNVSGVGGPPARATLKLYVIDGSESGGSVYSVSNLLLDGSAPWSETTLKWPNAPEVSDAPLSTVGAVSVGETVEFDVTPAIAGDGMYSFALRTPSSDVVKYSSRQGLVAPELVLETAVTLAKTGDSEENEEVTPEVALQRVPETVELLPIYPNPFNAEATIAYTLPEAAQVKLTVFNVRGQAVRVLVRARQTAGRHKVQWNGRDGQGQAVSSGVYFLRLEALSRRITRRVLLQK